MVFQCLGIKAFAAESKYLVNDRLYLFIEPLDICNKQQAAVNGIEVSVMCLMVSQRYGYNKSSMVSQSFWQNGISDHTPTIYVARYLLPNCIRSINPKPLETIYEV